MTPSNITPLMGKLAAWPLDAIETQLKSGKWRVGPYASPLFITYHPFIIIALPHRGSGVVAQLVDAFWRKRFKLPNNFRQRRGRFQTCPYRSGYLTEQAFALKSAQCDKIRPVLWIIISCKRIEWRWWTSGLYVMYPSQKKPPPPAGYAPTVRVLNLPQQWQVDLGKT